MKLGYDHFPVELYSKTWIIYIHVWSLLFYHINAKIIVRDKVENHKNYLFEFGFRKQSISVLIWNFFQLR